MLAKFFAMEEDVIITPARPKQRKVKGRVEIDVERCKACELCAIECKEHALNAVYGMTSGQMAPTTLPGMCTTTTPTGRDISFYGHPIRVSELMSQLPGAFYVTRQVVNSSNGVRRTKKALQKAFEYQQLKR